MMVTGRTERNGSIIDVIGGNDTIETIVAEGVGVRALMESMRASST